MQRLLAGLPALLWMVRPSRIGIGEISPQIVMLSATEITARARLFTKHFNKSDWALLGRVLASTARGFGGPL